jgi:hypothetical protein
VSAIPDQAQELIKAKHQAQRLLDELVRQQKQMSSEPAGQAALNEAIAAARETLASLEAAITRD